ncbi:hypothetical protein sos41_34670 [Alphaproteobacteria bacterium SO-S41]|nr:hypothetical protein sos41_34670 [Alphaproteobacteria bacterium SO-S41]
MLYRLTRLFLLCLAAALITPAHADTPAPTVIVVDSSNSMSAALDGEARLDTARKVLNSLLAEWRADAPLGLIAYGHRRKSDCDDIEVLAPIGPVDAPALAERLTALRAKGKTPLASSIERAADLLSANGAGGTIILVTDGIETCRADPCAVAAALHKANAGLRIHVIGFAVDAKDEEQLSCIAEAGGGDYRTASNAETLLAEMDEVAAKAVAAPLPPPAPEPPPPPPTPEPPRALHVAFTAVIKGEGPLVDYPADWRITGIGDSSFTYEGSARGLSLELLPGRYAVEARASNALGKTEIEVTADTSTVEIELPAGRLTAHAVAYKGAAALDETAGLIWTLEPLDGQGAVAPPTIAKPAWLLAPGRYRLTVTRGPQTATAEVTIAPGTPVDSELSFKLGELKLSAAIAAEGDPLIDWSGMIWRALKADGSVAAESQNEAQPLFVLPEGAYTVELGLAGATLKATLDVREGATLDHRFVVPTGTRTFIAALSDTAEPLSDWRDTYWTVTPVEAIGLEAGKPVAENQGVSGPELMLMPGRWTASVVSGLVTVTADFTVAPDTTETVRINLNAAKLHLDAAPAPGAPEAVNIVFTLVSAATPDAVPLTLGGSRRTLDAIVSAGKWRVVATDEQGRTVEQDLDLAAGDTRDVALVLK